MSQASFVSISSTDTYLYLTISLAQQSFSPPLHHHAPSWLQDGHPQCKPTSRRKSTCYFRMPIHLSCTIDCRQMSRNHLARGTQTRLCQCHRSRPWSSRTWCSRGTQYRQGCHPKVTISASRNSWSMFMASSTIAHSPCLQSSWRLRHWWTIGHSVVSILWHIRSNLSRVGSWERNSSLRVVRLRRCSYWRGHRHWVLVQYRSRSILPQSS